jgi:hypothetical protein
MLHLEIFSFAKNQISHHYFLVSQNLPTRFENKIKFIPKLYLSEKLFIQEIKSFKKNAKCI